MDEKPRTIATAIVYMSYRALSLSLPIEFNKWCHFWTRMPKDSAGDHVQMVILKIVKLKNVLSPEESN
jgi:hypothetical protein